MSHLETASTTLLLELGCEELPAGPLASMAEAFGNGLQTLLKQASLLTDDHQLQLFYTPRRIAVQLSGVLEKQADQTIEKRGPSVSVAFDSDGNPTPAALGFARSVKADINDLQRLKTDQGEWLQYSLMQAGRSLSDILDQQLSDVINKIPMPKTMRWGNHSHRFIRPVHWFVALHGSSILPLQLFDLAASNVSYGHRIHSQTPITLSHADDYHAALKGAYVLADPKARQQRILEQVDSLADNASLSARAPIDLQLEVANLVEWPVAVLCSFDEAFLEVPAEALTLSMKTHQKFFPLYHKDENRLSHQFIAIANIESEQPDEIRKGFQRVIRPRLADAKFFWDQDKKQPLSAYFDRLDSVTFQQDLGTLADKSRRTQQIATRIAVHLGFDSSVVSRAAELSSCDLMTEMVGEFPELQGIMGHYYALASNEDAQVATAIEEHYQPVGAGRPIAESQAGRILAVAERADRLLGIFAAGKKPTGNKDPFALRRAALGLIRTCIEGGLEIDLDWLFQQCADILSDQIVVSSDIQTEVLQFVYDRLQGYLNTGEHAVSIQTFRAVLAKNVDNLLDFSARTQAVEAFSRLPAAISLAAANKRTGNLLRQNPLQDNVVIEEDRLTIAAEADIFKAISNLASGVQEAMQNRDYAAALSSLATLQKPVDQFFEDVMVMVDDVDLRNNRLALLAQLQSLCCQVADISELDV